MNVCNFFWFCFVFVIFNCCFCNEIPRPRIAIIGGGIGGAAASHFLTKLFNDNLEIDLFESNQLGGRLTLVDIQNKQFEAGGSIIHPRNKYMNDFLLMLEDTGLRKRPDINIGRSGVWNGEKFVFKESEWSIITYWSIFYRYGIQAFTLFKYINTILNDFENIYAHQDKGLSYDNVNDLLAAMKPDFPQMLQKSIKDHLQDLGYSERLIDELVKTTLVVNYGQENDVHSFVGAVSLAGATSGLWSVKGGNYQIPEKLITGNSKVKLIPAQVEKIRYLGKNDSAHYELFYRKNELKENLLNSKYDIVIIAAPLTSDQEKQIVFDDFPENVELLFPGQYQTTVATFAQATLNPLHFGLKEPLENILSCNPNKTVISSISRLSTVFGEKIDKKKPIWKIFSRKPLTLKYLAKIFGKMYDSKEIIWKAYPKYSTSVRNDKFVIHDFLYHVNAIEWAASAMEMSAIGGRNVAILAHKHFQNKNSSPITSSSEKVTPFGERKSEL